MCLYVAALEAHNAIEKGREIKILQIMEREYRARDMRHPYIPSTTVLGDGLITESLWVDNYVVERQKENL